MNGRADIVTTAVALEQAGAVPLRWDVNAYLAAWEAGALPKRTQLIDGQIWLMPPVGSWHGRTTVRMAQLLHRDEVVVTMQTLVLADDFAPDPDLWVHAADAAPSGAASPRMTVWDPTDVLLLVEVADTSLRLDTGRKADRYAAAGIRHYWVVTPHSVIVFTDPGPDGYGTRRTFESGERVPYLEGTLAVDDIIRGK